MLLLITTALAADPFETHATVHTLDNGLTVLLDEDHRTDAVALHLRYGVGSRDELPGERGFAHCFEHLMFEGSENVPNNAFDEWLEAAGGWNNAWTSEDATAYHEVVPSGALDLALFLESDRLGFLDGGLDAENLQNQQKVVLQERAEGYAEPHGRDWDSLSRLQFPEGHPYHIPVIGTVADIEGLELSQATDFWHRWYRPQNAVLAVVGNVGTDVLADVEHWFSDVADPGPSPERAAPWTGDYIPADGYVEDTIDYRALYISWATVPHGHEDEPALDLLATLLSNGRGTRLDDRMYYDSRLSFYSGAFTTNGDVDGQLVLIAVSPRTRLVRLQRVMEQVLDSVSESPPDQSELDRAKTSIKAGWLDQLERYDSRADLFIECYRDYGDPNCLPQEWARYEAVTADDVVAAAERWLVPERRVTLSVVPNGDKKTIPGASPVELP